MKLYISEDEKKEIMSKYEGNTSDRYLNYLRRNFPVSTYKMPKFNSTESVDIPFIKIDDKSYQVVHNKKELVNRIFFSDDSDFADVDVNIKRRTIKRYIDMILNTNYDK